MLRHLVKKEFLQLRRDRRMFPIVFVAPVLQLLILGYAATFDVRNIRTVVLDRDNSPESRDYLDAYFTGSYFERKADLEHPDRIGEMLDRGEADLAVVVPRGFGEAVVSGGSTQVQIIVDGTDANAGGVGLGYAAQISALYSADIMKERLRRAGGVHVSIAGVEDRVLYNPELKSRNYMVPAILALLLLIMTMMLTAMAIVREKEIGTMEQLAVTPVRGYQVIIGKLLPYILIGLVDVAIVCAVAVGWFRVPLRGSFLLLYALSLPFLLNTLGLGLLVSTVSRTQQQAMMTVMFFVMLPFIYFSGFVFPIENMPKFFQYVSYGVPLRYYLEIIRGIFLKGVGMEVLWPQAAALTAMGLGILAVAVPLFRKQV
jgi:ABC-2 type transport system permease protein